MATTQIFSLILVFGAVAGASVAVVGWMMPRPIQTRLKQAAGEAAAEVQSAPSVWQEKIVSALSPAGKLTVPKEGWENSALRKQFMQAGIRKEQAVLIFFAVKTFLTFVLPIAFMLYAGMGRIPVSLNAAMMAIVGLAAVGYYAPNMWLRRRVANRQREMFEALPDAIDLMTVMVEAGLGLDAARSTAGPLTPHAGVGGQGGGYGAGVRSVRDGAWRRREPVGHSGSVLPRHEGFRRRRTRRERGDGTGRSSAGNRVPGGIHAPAAHDPH